MSGIEIHSSIHDENDDDGAVNRKLGRSINQAPSYDLVVCQYFNTPYNPDYVYIIHYLNSTTQELLIRALLPKSRQKGSSHGGIM